MADIEIIKKYKFFDLEFKKLDDAADFFCVSKQMMSAVFSGQKKPSKQMLEKAGVRKVTQKFTAYEKISA